MSRGAGPQPRASLTPEPALSRLGFPWSRYPALWRGRYRGGFSPPISLPLGLGPRVQGGTRLCPGPRGGGALLGRTLGLSCLLPFPPGWWHGFRMCRPTCGGYRVSCRAWASRSAPGRRTSSAGCSGEVGGRAWGGGGAASLAEKGCLSGSRTSRAAHVPRPSPRAPARSLAPVFGHRRGSDLCWAWLEELTGHTGQPAGPAHRGRVQARGPSGFPCSARSQPALPTAFQVSLQVLCGVWAAVSQPASLLAGDPDVLLSHPTDTCWAMPGTPVWPE